MAPAAMFTVVEMVLVPSLKETVLAPAFQCAAASRSNFSSVAPELKVKVTENVPEALCTDVMASSAVQSISEYASKFSPDVKEHVAKVFPPAVNRMLDEEVVNLKT